MDANRVEITVTRTPTGAKTYTVTSATPALVALVVVADTFRAAWREAAKLNPTTTRRA